MYVGMYEWSHYDLTTFHIPLPLCTLLETEINGQTAIMNEKQFSLSKKEQLMKREKIEKRGSMDKK